MTNLSLGPTQYTPEVILKTSGEISIKGKSYPENSFEFYQPIMHWLKTYLASEKENNKLVATFEIDYFNSSRSSVFYDIFDLFDQYHETMNIVIHWQYKTGNESLQEAGEDFCEDFANLNIQLREV